MHYDQARKIGDAGEKRVADKLAQLKFTRDFVVFHDILIGTQTGRSKITAQLDHVLIDEMGVLVIETKVRTGALLRGMYSDSKWTACYPGGKKATFQNPLRQNEQHFSVLRQLLKETDPEISVETIRGCVVFVDADISQLELDSVTAQRVVNLDDLEFWYDDRRAFMVQTPLSGADQAALANQVARLDRSGDAAFTEAHAAYRSPGESKSAPTPAQPNPARKYVARQAPAQAPDSAEIPIRKIALAALVATAFIFLAWAVFAILSGHAPTWLWVVFFIMVAAFGGEEKTRRRRRYRSRSQSKQAPTSFGERILLTAFTMAFAVVLGLGAIWYLQNVVFRSLGASTTSSIPQAPASAAAEPEIVRADIGQAKRALKSAEPSVYKNLVRPNEPKTGVDGNRVSYEWEYLDKRGTASVSVERIKITLDAAGNIVGVTGQ